MSAKKRDQKFCRSDKSSHIHENINNPRIAAQSPLALSGGAGAACALILAAGVAAGGGVANADSILQQVGVTQLQQLAPALTGTGVAVAQVEASVSSTSLNEFEPNLASIGATVPQVTYFDAYGNSSGTYNPSYGSGHATYVASLFYGSGGVSTGVSSVTVYAEEGYYSDIYYDAPPSGGLSNNVPSVVNQSFMYPGVPSGTAQQLDQVWDNYAAQYNTLYVTAIGDGQTTATTPASYINPPADMYNGIAVGAYTGTETNGVFSPSTGSEATWVGPTWDGRSKPDITAPGAYTSYTAPIVSGVATLLEQAGRGANLPGPVGLSSSDSAISAQGATAYTTAATDIRTVKALLLNGAVKPTGWTNSYTVNSGTYTYNAVNANAITPLDPRYGSGVVNAYNSYQNLAGGEHTYSSATIQSIAALPSVTSAPTANFAGSVSQAASTTNPATVTGWNLATIAASSSSNAVENYDFNLTGTSLNSWDLTATLTWNKNYNASGINHLMLFLLNSAGQQVAASNSMVDNVQQININPALGINSLAPGQYDLAVEMLGGVNAISNSDTYALAWNFVDPVTVPEPATLAIFAIGLGLFMLPRKLKMAAQRA